VVELDPPQFVEVLGPLPRNVHARLGHYLHRAD
jgi:hypothetical protein